MRFKKKEYALLYDSGIIKRYIFIVLENENTGIYKPTIYSKYFNNYTNGLINKEINTKRNHANIIVNFLNYIFIDKYNEYNVSDIRELTLEMGERFLGDYAIGKIGGKNSKSANVISDANVKLSYFYKFLFDEFSLKYIDQNIFEFKEHKIKNTSTISIKPLFIVLYPAYIEKLKIKNITLYLASELIKIAEEFYPEIALGLALQAFGGLRAGEVCSLTTYCVNYGVTINEVTWLELDLRYDWQLRDNKKETGQIKKARIQPIHPAFMKVVSYLFKKHQNLSVNNKNPYNPLFINRDGNALIERSYYYKFTEIKNILIERLSSSPDILMRSQANLLMSGSLSPHSLRYFFSQFIADLTTTKSSVEIAYWRGDSDLSTAISYLASAPIMSEKLKIIQEETMKSILGASNND